MARRAKFEVSFFAILETFFTQSDTDVNVKKWGTSFNVQLYVVNCDRNSSDIWVSGSLSRLFAMALGGNLGDSRAILECALEILTQRPGIALQAHSSWYRTKAIGPPQPDYINGCAVLQAKICPQELLEMLQAIENIFGRVRAERWGPRTLDLDLLLCDDMVLDTPTLQLPHPRMRERAFVLVPLAEIAPNWLDPISGMSIGQLLELVDCSGVCRIF